MNRRVLQVISVAMLFALCATMAFAQDGETTEVHSKTWWDLFKTTGIVGILLVITSMIGTALLIQYMVNFNEVKIGNPTLLSEVDALLSENDLDGAFTLAQSDQSYAGKVIAGAIGRSVGGYEEARLGMEETAAVESFKISAKCSYLSLVGNIGPLLGLLGTVTGMISSFQVIETLKAPTPGDLAKGVYESLVNTTMGLFISIIFLSAYFFMKNKISDICLRVNNSIGEILSRNLSPEAQKEQGGAR
ncbi:MAG: MotA/TolQ/ExbB proton channel family protein [Planctomycetota bacterium]|nr:MAG: MotA/TolQ/ExbB proton channel family protein [Planctomycetota bacterium]